MLRWLLRFIGKFAVTSVTIIGGARVYSWLYGYDDQFKEWGRGEPPNYYRGGNSFRHYLRYVCLDRRTGRNMSIPLPALLAGIALILWPALHLLAALSFRRKIFNIRAGLFELEHDSSFSRSSIEAVRSVIKEDLKRDPEFLIIPVLFPGLVLFFSAQELRAGGASLSDMLDKAEADNRSSARELRAFMASHLELLGVHREEANRLVNDPRTIRVHEEAGTAAFLRWPVTMIFTFLTLLPTFGIYLLACGIGISWRSFLEMARTKFFLWRASHRSA